MQRIVTIAGLIALAAFAASSVVSLKHQRSLDVVSCEKLPPR
jgi:hypothetical protein